jgi:hypothetical protein
MRSCSPLETNGAFLEAPWRGSAAEFAARSVLYVKEFDGVADPRDLELLTRSTRLSTS